jgi:hypothetical protein
MATRAAKPLRRDGGPGPQPCRSRRNATDAPSCALPRSQLRTHALTLSPLRGERENGLMRGETPAPLLCSDPDVPLRLDLQ